MKIIYLIRHGQASFGEKNYDQLSPLGYSQSELLAKHLKSMAYPIDAIFGGTLNRHQQTALATLSEFRKPANDLIINKDWNEFDHQHVFNIARQSHSHWADNAHHTSQAEMLSRFTLAVSQWINSENDALYTESWSQFAERSHQALVATIKQVEKIGIVFTSGGVIAALVGRQWHLAAQQTMQLNWTLINTGITKLLVRGNSIQVSSVNVHSHLDCQEHKQKITYK